MHGITLLFEQAIILVKTYHQNIIYTVQLLAECVARFFQDCKTLTEGELTNKMI